MKTESEMRKRGVPESEIQRHLDRRLASCDSGRSLFLLRTLDTVHAVSYSPKGYMTECGLDMLSEDGSRVPFIRPSLYCPECEKNAPLTPKGQGEEIVTYTETLDSDPDRPHVFLRHRRDYRAASSSRSGVGHDPRSAVLASEGVKPALLRKRGSLSLIWEHGACFTDEEVDVIAAEFAAIVSRYR